MGIGELGAIAHITHLHLSSKRARQFSAYRKLSLRFTYFEKRYIVPSCNRYNYFQSENAYLVIADDRARASFTYFIPNSGFGAI